ncbi:MAG: hypothetical protein H7Y88_06130 [Phycisphaerales bacterium]|nr:hypothetical protein [Phycisphaerales bacterium]
MRTLNTRARVGMVVAACGVVVGAAGVGSASGDIIRGSYTLSYTQGVTVQTPLLGSGQHSVNTTTFQWMRTDTPGPGVDSVVPNAFKTYCIEINQTIGGGQHTFDVLTPADAGFSLNQELWLSRLWGGYQGQVDSSTESAAFQIAVWEVMFDNGLDLLHGDFKVTGSGNAKTLAQDWLSDVSSEGYDGPQSTLAVLRSESVQDQLTAVSFSVPSPTSALGLAGVGLLGLRRRRAGW